MSDNRTLIQRLDAAIAGPDDHGYPCLAEDLTRPELADLITDAKEAIAWQPIEAAPRDGTEIIGFRPDQGVFVFRWAWMEEFVPKDQNGDPTEEYDDSFAWWWHDRWFWMEGDETPTHWMPLPPAPELAQGTGQ